LVSQKEVKGQQTTYTPKTPLNHQNP